MKPTIALTCRIQNFDNQNRIYNNYSYFEALQQAGGIPVIVPIVNQKEAEQIADQFDGLCVTGGEDLDPALFNQNPHPSITQTWKEIDETDLFLIHAFLKRKKPILGICRGIQVINVALGGDLYQDINTQVCDIDPRFHQQNKVEGYSMNDVFHRVDFKEGTWLHAICGKSAMVNSFHHQAVKDLAPSLTCSALSPDGIIEAAEIKGQLLAVQWHPEKIISDPKQLAIFKNFIALCSR